MAAIEKTTSGAPIYGVDDERYTRRFRLRKVTGPVTLLSSPGWVPAGLIRSHFPGYTKQDHLDAARYFSILREEVAKEHGTLVRKALERYGDHGPLIAGVVRDHFPKKVKDTLRHLARLASDANGASQLHWKASGKRTHYQDSGLAVRGRAVVYSA